MRINVSYLPAILLLVIGVYSPQSLAAKSLPDFTELVEEFSPAVVKIITSKKHRQDPFGRGQRGRDQDLFRHFFGPRRHYQPSQSLGSGFVISEDGYILTNYHVIGHADEIIVRLIDRREFNAEVIGADETSDLALLKIAAEGLKTVSFAQKNNLKVGEWVLAIGSPFGMDYSVTAGIVSAKGRSLPTENNENYVPFIQTDVAINRGNSGGPLFNLSGEVVGINSQMYSPTGGYVGLSFAIPSDVALQVVAQLKEHGSVIRGWLGVVIQEVNKKLADSFGLDRPKGALVVQMVKGGPAADAGIREGDIIINFDNRDIKTSADLPHIVGQTGVGKQVNTVVIRDGKRQTLKVVVGALPNGNDTKDVASNVAVGGRLGLEVGDIDEQFKKQWNLNGGVVVRTVRPKSPASDAGLQVGDVIAQLGYQQIDSIDAFHKAEKELPSNRLLPMRVVRKGVPSFETIMIEE